MLSTQELANFMGISKSSAYKALRGLGYKAYHFQNHQELLGRDSVNRNAFCELMLEKLRNDTNFFKKILFTYEATFTLNGEINSQNCRYWSITNQHLFNATNNQNQARLNVWAGLINQKIIGPFYIDGNLTGEKYLTLLETKIIPALELENLGDDVFLQQDGAPAHYSCQVRNYLNEKFRNRWIGRGGPISWPARSPDLSPNDFFYWGYMKNNVYTGERFGNLEELKLKINEISQTISGNMILNVIRGFENRLRICIDQNGGIFENLL
jgi:hypothetical protein